MSYIIKKIDSRIDVIYNIDLSTSDDFLYLLTIKNNKFLINFYDDNLYFCNNSKLIFYHSYDRIILFDSVKGNLLLLMRLFDSFLNVISLENDLLILTDTTFFKISKSNYCIYDLNFLPDEIIDFEILDKSKILLKLSNNLCEVIENTISPMILPHISCNG
jgi:hypothetical protein